MSKEIIRFRSEPFGLFIDLNGGGLIGVNRKSGEILLDEGAGPDAYHGAVLSADDFKRFTLSGPGEVLTLHFGDSNVHPLGKATEPADAQQWIQEAERVIRAYQIRSQDPEAKSLRREDKPEGPFGYSAKLYVGNLSFKTTETDLQDLFATVGPVQEIIIMQDRMTAQSRGFGFVTMVEPADVGKVIKLFHGKTVDGRELTVNEARPREQRMAGGNEARAVRWQRR